MEDFAALYMEVVPLAMKILRTEVRKEAKEYLTIPQFRILANISGGLSSINEISAHHGVSQPAMSKMVETLVQKDLISREIDSADRRCCVLKLTPKGKTLFNKIKKKTYKNLEGLLPAEETSKRELEKALMSLKTFVRNMENKA